MMELVMYTEKNDIVFYTEKTGMLMLVVKIDVGGMTADVVDNLTCSFDYVQPKQVDMRCAHALTELHCGNVYQDNINEYVSQAAAANFNQGNIGFRPQMVANQIRPPGFSPVQNNQKNFNRVNNFTQNRRSNFNQSAFNQSQLHRPRVNQAPA
nr:hypothetical protein [Tanacetum cinerariifolium]